MVTRWREGAPGEGEGEGVGHVDDQLGLLYITGGRELREKTTEPLRDEIEGDCVENGGDEDEVLEYKV